MNFSEVDLAKIKFNDEGLVPAIVQSSNTKRVLMMAWMNEASLRKTLLLEQAVFFSRSRKSLWHKGATSGNFQSIDSISIDCDGDTLLLLVNESGPACHLGTESCFETTLLSVREPNG